MTVFAAMYILLIEACAEILRLGSILRHELKNQTGMIMLLVLRHHTTQGFGCQRLQARGVKEDHVYYHYL
jgi:hypothetical protein